MSNGFWWVLGAFVLYVLVRNNLSSEGAINPAEANAFLANQKGVQLVDVRTAEEYQGGHLPQARNIPLDRFADSLGVLKADQPLLLYCHSGRRSSMAYKIVKAKGFTQARHLKGGIIAWGSAGYPILK